jgi:hypothetical protein
LYSHPELALPTFESFGGEAPEAENAGQQELELAGIGLTEESNGDGGEDGAMRKMHMGSFGINEDFLSFNKNGEHACARLRALTCLSLWSRFGRSIRFFR